MEKQYIHGNGNTQVYVGQSGPIRLAPGPGLRPCPVCQYQIGVDAPACGHCFTDFKLRAQKIAAKQLQQMAIIVGGASFSALLVAVKVVPLVPWLGSIQAPLLVASILGLMFAAVCVAPKK